MISVNDLRPGVAFSYENQLLVVLNTQLNKTAMRQMIVKIKVKNLKTGAITELSFTGGDKVDTVHLDKRPMQYLYDDGTDLVFMDNETYDQVSISKEKLEWERNFLVENQDVEITMYEGEILGIALPVKVTLKVTETSPAVRGDTATKATKDAILETGYLVKVPLFIEEGEDLIIRTDTGEYDSRA
ncbi:MAG: elongation factor P [Bacilli bacterium]|nr:elongation factor P [Bacilli bacterium]